MRELGLKLRRPWVLNSERASRSSKSALLSLGSADARVVRAALSRPVLSAFKLYSAH